jgi:hypothetical protein
MAIGAVLALLSGACDRADPVDVEARLMTPGGADPARLLGDYDYTIIRMPPEFAGPYFSIDRANTHGDLVGNVWGGEGSTGMLLSKGVVTRIQPPGAAEAWANGINERGDVVGSYLDGTGLWRGFHYARGHYTTITVPLDTGDPSPHSSVWDVNDKGVMTGGFLAEDGRIQGFLYDRGKVARLRSRK